MKLNVGAEAPTYKNTAISRHVHNHQPIGGGVGAVADFLVPQHEAAAPTPPPMEHTTT